RDQQKLLVAILLAEPFCDLVAFHVGEAEVEKHYLGVERTGSRYCRLTVVDGKGLVTILFEKICKSFRHGLLVVHDQDPERPNLVGRWGTLAFGPFFRRTSAQARQRHDEHAAATEAVTRGVD